MLFGVADVAKFYRTARDITSSGESQLHLRLLIDPRAPSHYHALRWETLCDPDDRRPVATRRNVFFSRYLSGVDWRPVSPPAKHALRALVVVANPSNIGDYAPQDSSRRFPPVAVDDEIARARAALSDMNITVLRTPDAMLSRIIQELDRRADKDGGIDVLYLVCHAKFNPHTPDSVLYLEGVDGTTAPTSGRTLANRILDLRVRPTIAVLCACQTAGTGSADSASDDNGALAAIGPRLAAAGTPVVIAMQGNVSMTTMATFLPTFFRTLKEDGVVDRAVAVARQDVENRPDWWMPVLFSRLRTGRTYYIPDFADGGKDTWRALVSQVSAQRCTPIIGSGLTDDILGSREDVAGRWVDRWQAPVASHIREDLAKIAQYLQVRVSAAMPANELSDYVKAELHAKYRNVLDPSVFEAETPMSAISAVGRLRRAKDEHDRFGKIASLPFPIYVTTGWTSLIEDALSDVGRAPTTRFFDWNGLSDADNNASIDEPTVKAPLVYHLFGTFSDPDSMVLSEDSYFEWLQAWITKRPFLLPPISKALTRRSLLFLGYRLDDWDFRVLFQAVRSFGGSDQMRRNQHVGVQLGRENQMIDPEAAQEYLGDYFGPNNVDIFWGEPRRFIDELCRKYHQEA
jgi:hypothetical protein